MTTKTLLVENILNVLLTFELQKDRNPVELKEFLMSHNHKTIEIWYSCYVKYGYIS